MMLWVALALGSPCEQVGPGLDAASAAAEDLRVEEAAERLQQVERDLTACPQVADRAALARLWMLEGILQVVAGDDAAADLAFAAAGRVDWGAWNDAFGPKLRARWDAVQRAAVWPGRIRIEPELGANQHWLDGERAEGELELASGLHLVQVAGPDGVVRFARVVLVGPAQTLALDTGVPTAAPLPVEPPARDRSRRKLRPLAVLAVGSAVAGAGLAGLSAQQHAAMGRAKTGGQLRGAWRGSVGAGAGGVALLGLSGLALGLHVVR